MRVPTLIIGFLFLTCPVAAQEPPKSDVQPPSTNQGEVADNAVPKVTKDKPMGFWMKHKLEYSKTILESLTMGDYEKLAATAKQMRLLGKIEGFVRRKNNVYRTQMRTFDLAALELERHAKQENPDGATLAFNQLTHSCVACHALLRKGIE